MSDLYSAQNLPQENTAVIQQAYAEAMATAEGALAEIEYLKSALQLYKTSLAKRINYAVQEADLLSKYTRSTQSNGSYGLPGVFADVTGGYDMAQIKADKDVLMTIQQDNDNAKKQTDMYYRMVSSDVQDLNRKLAKLGGTYSNLLAFISQLETYAQGNMA